MKFSEVKELLAAGFTADEIRGMLADPEQNKEEKPAETPAKPAETPAGTPAEDKPAENDAVRALSETVKELQKTIKEMQAANVAGAQQEQKKTPTAEDAIKKFLSKM
jgi:DNA-binding transcriptional MerR regulator